MDQKIKTIIVDDEFEAREGLKLLLEKDDDISLVTDCKNGIEAIEALTNFKIDLMFLDIQMPMVDGFEVVRSTPHDRLPAIVFTTAYDQYAVKAFEVHAIDYLLKPFSDERFHESLDRAKALVRQKDLEDEARKLEKIAEGVIKTGATAENILIDPESPESKSRLIIKENGQIHFIDLSDIIWIEAYDYYVKVHIANRYYMLRESMKKLIQRLPDKLFARIHKSSIINLNFIKTIDLLGNGEYQILLNSGEQLKVSRGFKDKIKHLI